jgi:hypothetical protein
LVSFLVSFFVSFFISLGALVAIPVYPLHSGGQNARTGMRPF